MPELIFLLLALVLAWAYVGYPLAMEWRAARARRRRVEVTSGGEAAASTISIVLPVRDGERWLERRLAELLEQAWSGEREVVVVLNGCRDGSRAVAERVARREPAVRVLESPPEDGKSGALAAGVAAAAGEVVVFADVRQRWSAGTVRRLAARLREPGVGAVTGRLVWREAGSAATRGFNRYWGYETRLRLAESESGSVIGATGAIWAARRSLYPSLPAGVILDDVYAPLSIAAAGYRVVMEAEAIAHDEPSSDDAAEYARRVRHLVGNLQLLRLMPWLLHPRRNPVWGRYVSHKLLRVLTPLLLPALLLAGLLSTNLLARSLALVLAAVYVLGAVGIALRLRALALPSAFVLAHTAGISALLRPGRGAAQVWHRPSGGDA